MRQIIGRRGEPHTTRRPVPEVPTRRWWRYNGSLSPYGTGVRDAAGHRHDCASGPA